MRVKSSIAASCASVLRAPSPAVWGGCAPAALPQEDDNKGSIKEKPLPIVYCFSNIAFINAKPWIAKERSALLPTFKNNRVPGRYDDPAPRLPTPSAGIAARTSHHRRCTAHCGGAAALPAAWRTMKPSQTGQTAQRRRWAAPPSTLPSARVLARDHTPPPHAAAAPGTILPRQRTQALP
jgi:hypothetical protein